MNNKDREITKSKKSLLGLIGKVNANDEETKSYTKQIILSIIFGIVFCATVAVMGYCIWLAQHEAVNKLSNVTNSLNILNFLLTKYVL